VLTSCVLYGIFNTMAIDKNAVLKDAQKYAAKGQYAKAIAE